MLLFVIGFDTNPTKVPMPGPLKLMLQDNVSKLTRHINTTPYKRPEYFNNLLKARKSAMEAILNGQDVNFSI